MAVDDVQHKQLFERFCQERFYEGSCTKTLSREKREKVVKLLRNEDAPGVSATFRFWVKNRGFQLVSMDGTDVLCLPTKHKVNCTSGLA